MGRRRVQRGPTSQQPPAVSTRHDAYARRWAPPCKEHLVHTSWCIGLGILYRGQSAVPRAVVPAARAADPAQSARRRAAARPSAAHPVEAGWPLRGVGQYCMHQQQHQGGGAGHRLHAAHGGAEPDVRHVLRATRSSMRLAPAAAHLALSSGHRHCCSFAHCHLPRETAQGRARRGAT